jgi:hypothetical protein
MARVSTMNNQGKLFRGSSITGVVGIVLAVLLMAAFGGVTGAAVAVMTVATVAFFAVAAAAICVALATYREQGRKPGSLPLIYAVTAFPAGLLLLFLYLAFRFTPLGLIAFMAILTSVPALVIGLVKKLSVKAAPVVPVAGVVAE